MGIHFVSHQSAPPALVNKIWILKLGLGIKIKTTHQYTSFGLGDQDSIPGRAQEFSLYHHIQTSSETHLASYLMRTWGFPQR
jgi:hypothetical protein